jgi:hypothetical protein
MTLRQASKLVHPDERAPQRLAKPLQFLRAVALEHDGPSERTAYGR